LLDAGRKTLIFDMSGVTHIDSTGMGRFIDTYGKLQKVGGSMLLAGASGTVREVFRVTRLDRVFRFYDSVAEAEATG
jgi:anti-sigma B factor antagonist